MNPYISRKPIAQLVENMRCWIICLIERNGDRALLNEATNFLLQNLNKGVRVKTSIEATKRKYGVLVETKWLNKKEKQENVYYKNTDKPVFQIKINHKQIE